METRVNARTTGTWGAWPGVNLSTVVQNNMYQCFSHIEHENTAIGAGEGGREGIHYLRTFSSDTMWKSHSLLLW